jgi:hypothetical protein
VTRMARFGAERLAEQQILGAVNPLREAASLQSVRRGIVLSLPGVSLSRKGDRRAASGGVKALACIDIATGLTPRVGFISRT